MSTLITGATSWLATYLVQSTLLLLGALALVRWLRDPAARERVWKIALVAPLFTASLGWLLPAGARPVLDLSPALRAGVVQDAEPAPSLAGAPASSVTMTTLIVNPRAPETSSVPVAVPREEPAKAVVVAPPWNWLAIAAVALWVAGAAFLLTRRAVALRRLKARLASRRTVRKGMAHDLLADLCSDDELSVRPRLTLADELSTPLVLGLGEICLPRRVAEELPERELAAILAHEVAHVRRGDLLWLRGCALLECVLFAQPLNRVARQRLLQDAELLCDDWAGERTGARLELAQGLETVARWSRVVTRPLPLPCLGGDKGALLQRVERLLAEPAARRRTVAVTTMLGAVVVAMACVGPSVTTGGGGSAPDLDSLDTAALITLRKQACACATERLLALPAGWERDHAGLLSLPGAKAVRVLQRGLYDLSPKDQGGSYYSFALDDHDYQREPDLGYEGKEIRTGFAGDDTGHVLDLGEVPLASVTVDGPIEGPDAQTARLRAFLSSYVPDWKQRADDNVRADDAFRAASGLQARDVGRAVAVAGHSYLLRSILPGEHDLLAAFTLVQVQPESIVLVGRILKTWPIAEPVWPTRPVAAWSSEGAPAWLIRLDDASLVALQSQLAALVETRLLGKPADAAAPAAKDSGTARILQSGRYSGLMRVRGDGAYFSFVTRSNSYDEEPDLEWNQKQFTTGFYGSNDGSFLDLGDTPLADVEAAKLPANLVGAPQEAGGRVNRSNEVRAAVGHTYVLRSVLKDEHDVLAAFRPLQQDDYGMTIDWRVLHRYD
jgi:beta-lactamase regulating signal transducer with metallopeptidase domain